MQPQAALCPRQGQPHRPPTTVGGRRGQPCTATRRYPCLRTSKCTVLCRTCGLCFSVTRAPPPHRPRESRTFTGGRCNVINAASHHAAPISAMLLAQGDACPLARRYSLLLFKCHCVSSVYALSVIVCVGVNLCFTRFPNLCALRVRVRRHCASCVYALSV